MSHLILETPHSWLSCQTQDATFPSEAYCSLSTPEAVVPYRLLYIHYWKPSSYTYSQAHLLIFFPNSAWWLLFNKAFLESEDELYSRGCWGGCWRLIRTPQRASPARHPTHPFVRALHGKKRRRSLFWWGLMSCSRMLRTPVYFGIDEGQISSLSWHRHCRLPDAFSRRLVSGSQQCCQSAASSSWYATNITPHRGRQQAAVDVIYSRVK
jgi:hypothetical protein